MEINLLLFGAVYGATLLVFIFSGMPIAFALGGLGILSIYVCIGGAMLEQITYVALNAVSSFTLSAIPLFVLMGAIFGHSGLAAKVYGSISPLMCRLLPGGLLHSNVFGGAIFATATGSCLASTATIGLIALSPMEDRGYQRGITAGSICAGGVLGILIPPSISLIIYGAITEVSVGKLFIAGIIPGIILTAAYMSYIGIRLKMQPELGPPREMIPWRTCLIRSIMAWPMLILILAVLGTIYLGIATPTEAAAMGCAGALALVAVFHLLTWETVKKVTWETVRTSSMILFIYAGAKVMGIGIALLKVPDQLMDIIISLGLSKHLVLSGIYLFFITGGMLMASLPLLVMVLPIIFPILVSLGFDPVWAGIVFTMLGECGALSPPVGLCLYVIQGLRPEYKFSEIAMGALPFCILILSVLVLITVSLN